MPEYTFKCPHCEEEGEKLTFSVRMSMKEFDSKADCPQCGQMTMVRVYDAPLMTIGRTANEKTAGTTKARFDSGKYFRDAREKRKKNYGPDTRAGISNELWVGTETKDGVFKGPSGIKSANVDGAHAAAAAKLD